MTSKVLSILRGMKGATTTIAKDRLDVAEFSGTINTGSMALNAAVSGSLYGGIQDNKIVCLGGLAGTYKTYYAIQIAGQFLRDRPNGLVIWYDTEAATTADMMESRGCDTSRVLRPQDIDCVEALKNHIIQFIEEYIKLDESEREPIMFVIDSVSALPSLKEVEDAIKGDIKRDMTRAQIWHSLFRSLQIRLGKARAPLLCTSHIMMEQGAYVPTAKIKGTGEAIMYAASLILMLRKSKLAKDIEGTREQVGNLVSVTIAKSRFTREGKKIVTKMTFDKGLDPYYGLIDIAFEAGVFKKQGKKILLPDGSTEFESRIEKDPEKYFTKEVLDLIEKECPRIFMFGEYETSNLEDDIPVEDEVSDE